MIQRIPAGNLIGVEQDGDRQLVLEWCDGSHYQYRAYFRITGADLSQEAPTKAILFSIKAHVDGNGFVESKPARISDVPDAFVYVLAGMGYHVIEEDEDVAEEPAEEQEPFLQTATEQVGQAERGIE